MEDRVPGPPRLRAPTLADLRESLRLGLRDLAGAPLTDLWLAGIIVALGLAIGAITLSTGQSYWLVLATMGFPLVGTLAALGFYEVSRRRGQGAPIDPGTVLRAVWRQRRGQVPWLAAIIVVIFLFWFFLGHMIFALFLGLSPMTNVSTSTEVFLAPQGLAMLAVGSLVGAAFATLVFAISVVGIPALLDRDIDFVTAMLLSIRSVAQTPAVYLAWGAFIGLVTVLSVLPLFLGLFLTLPILGHASWHLYVRLSDPGRA